MVTRAETAEDPGHGSHDATDAAGVAGPAGLDPHGFGPGSVGDLLDGVEVRTAQLVERIGAEGARGLDAPTALDGWSHRHVACHLRYGAEATLRMTLAALHGETTSWYPRGRPRQRPTTLEPRPGEVDDALVRSLASTAAALARLWRDLRPSDWSAPLVAAETDDPRDLTVAGLLVLRATEVEVHGTDLDVGLPDWSPSFVAAALPVRLAGLDGRWPADTSSRSWLLEVDDGATWEVHVRAGVASARAVTGEPPPVDARIGGAARDVLALLLGRHAWDRLDVTGDVAAAHGFAEAFPGP